MVQKNYRMNEARLDIGKEEEGGENRMCFGPQLATSFPQDYSVEGMSDSLLNFLQHLREFGLVFQRKV